MEQILSKGTAVIGNEVTFGKYQQGAKSDDMTDIQWLVLTTDGEKVLLLSKNGLDAKPYHQDLRKMTWERSDVRQWLNTDFFNIAFAPKEQAAILLTKVDNGPEQGFIRYDTDGGNDTEDKVFLLSYKEAFKEYFVDDESRTCKPTAYARKRGADVNLAGNCRWWLRSPGSYQETAACLYCNGSRYFDYVNDGIYCVRPALWVDLNSEIFENTAQ